MNLENSVSDIEKCYVKKVVVFFKWKIGKDVKTDTNTQMKQYPIQDLRWIWDVTSIYKNRTPEPVGMGHQCPRRGPAQQADEEGQDIYSNYTLADEATKLSKLPTLTLIWRRKNQV